MLPLRVVTYKSQVRGMISGACAREGASIHMSELMKYVKHKKAAKLCHLIEFIYSAISHDFQLRAP
jgi:hypothetical protein